MEDSFSRSISKDSVFESQTFLQAAIDDADLRETNSLSNEEINKGDKLLDVYEITSEAIPGGMGSVWPVFHMDWKIELAMKRPKPIFFAEASKSRNEKFIKECENWIGLGLHPNIVSCYYVREIGGVPSIFSEWMDGGSLKDQIKSGVLYEGDNNTQIERLLDIAIQAARGLRYSHDRKLLHLDIKPGNILMTKGGDVKIADFGLAGARNELTQGTDFASGYTLEYCPDAQKQKKQASYWMDAFAYAVTVLEMFKGERDWDSGQEAYKDFNKLVSNLKVPMPNALKELLKEIFSYSVEKMFFKKDDTGIMRSVEKKLLEIYSASIGQAYERPDADTLSDTVGTLNNIALSFYDLGKDEFAEPLIERAYEENPNDPSVVYNRNIILFRQDRIEPVEALTELREVIELNNNSRDAFYYLRMCLEPQMIFPLDELKKMLELAEQHSPLSSDEKKTIEQIKLILEESEFEEALIAEKVKNVDAEEILIGFDHYGFTYSEKSKRFGNKIRYYPETGRFLMNDKVNDFRIVRTGIYHADTGELEEVREFDGIEKMDCYAMSPDGRQLFFAGIADIDRAWYDTVTGASYPLVKEAPGIGYVVSYDPSSSWMLGEVYGRGWYNRRVIGMFSYKGQYCEDYFEHTDRILALDWGESKIISASKKELYVYDIKSKEKESIIEYPEQLNAISLSEDRSIAVGRGKALYFFDLETGECTKEIPISIEGSTVIFRRGNVWTSSPGKAVANKGTMLFMPKEELSKFAGLEIKQIHSYVELSADAQLFEELIASAKECMEADPKKAMRLIKEARSIGEFKNNKEALDLQNICTNLLKDCKLSINSRILRSKISEKGIARYSVVYSRSGNRIAYFREKDFVVRDVETLSELFVVNGYAGERFVRPSIAISNDGERIFAGNMDNIGTLFGSRGNVLWKKFYSAGINAAAFSEDGRHIVIAFAEGTDSAALIDATSGEVINVTSHKSEAPWGLIQFIDNDNSVIAFTEPSNACPVSYIEYHSIPDMSLQVRIDPKMSGGFTKPFTYNGGEDVTVFGGARFKDLYCISRSRQERTLFPEQLESKTVITDYEMLDEGRILAFADQHGNVVITNKSEGQDREIIYTVATEGNVYNMFFTEDKRYLAVFHDNGDILTYELDWDYE